MSEIYEVNPDKSYEGWETLDDDSQVFKDTVLHFHQQQPMGSTSEQAKHVACSQWEKKVHIEEHQCYEIVIESPGVKAALPKVEVVEVVDVVSMTKTEVSEKKATANISDD